MMDNLFDFEELCLKYKHLYCGTMKNIKDIHCWVVKNDGSIYDPYFDEYNKIKLRNNLSNEQCYEEFPRDNQNKLWKEYYWKFLVKPTICDNNGKYKQNMIKFYANKPQPFECMVNAFCYFLNNKEKGYRVAIGRMGWKIKNSNDVWWEFG